VVAGSTIEEVEDTMTAYYAKIDAAQSMATMIKRFLEHYEHAGNHDYRRRTKALRESLEAYRNA